MGPNPDPADDPQRPATSGAPSDRPSPPPGRAAGLGHLLVIGGREDQSDDKRILARFVRFSGGRRARVVVLTAASNEHERMARVYCDALGALGAAEVLPLRLPDRASAADPAVARMVAEAGGVFMTGGDQDRLVATIGGTPVADAIHAALRAGACVAGTSAGASALAARMPGPGSATDCELDPSQASPGLGLLHRLTIDQHFSERQRLARLLAMVAADPARLGLGIDEDTALAIGPGAWLEVIGKGAVTVLDARSTTISQPVPAPGGRCAVFGVRLHRLPDGFSRRVGGPAPSGPLASAASAAGPSSASLIDEVVTIVTDVRIDLGFPPA